MEHALEQLWSMLWSQVECDASVLYMYTISVYGCIFLRRSERTLIPLGLPSPRSCNSSCGAAELHSRRQTQLVSESATVLCCSDSSIRIQCFSELNRFNCMQSLLRPWQDVASKACYVRSMSVRAAVGQLLKCTLVAEADLMLVSSALGNFL